MLYICIKIMSISQMRCFHTQCLEVNHSLIISTISLSVEVRVATSSSPLRGSCPSVVLLCVLTRLGGREHWH